MSRPTDTLDGRLSWLDTVVARAALLPDVPPARLARLHEIRDWRRSVTHGPIPLPTRRGARRAELERQVHAHLEYIEEDRRLPVAVGDHQQSTTADGTGPAPGPDWPHNW